MPNGGKIFCCVAVLMFGIQAAAAADCVNNQGWTITGKCCTTLTAIPCLAET